MAYQVPDGFTPWSGGANPVPGKEVELIIRGGIRRATSWLADHIRWEHEGRGLDIIAYRVIN